MKNLTMDGKKATAPELDILSKYSTQNGNFCPLNTNFAFISKQHLIYQ